MESAAPVVALSQLVRRDRASTWWPLLHLPRCHTATRDYLGSSATNRVVAISDLRGSSRAAVAALVADADLVADGAIPWVALP
jgi:hypothetical protein